MVVIQKKRMIFFEFPTVNCPRFDIIFAEISSVFFDALTCKVLFSFLMGINDKAAGRKTILYSHAIATPRAEKSPRYLKGGISEARYKPINPAIVVIDVKVIGRHISNIVLTTISAVLFSQELSFSSKY